MGFFAEFSTGEDNDTDDITRALGEVNWRNSQETILTWVQVVATDKNRNSGLNSLMGVRWEPAIGWSLSTQYLQVLEPLEQGGGHPGSLTLQLRYRF